MGEPSGRTRRSSTATVSDLFESKLHPPPARPEIVHRTKLVDRLAASRDVPVVSIVSPPGYGKTTLLTQWAEHSGPRVAWLSLDEHDNDPRSLLTYAAAALDRVESIDKDALGLRRLGRTSVAANAMPRIAGAMSSMKEPVALVLDHVDLLNNRECLDAVAELALHLPAGSQLALATRAEPPLPLARLRAGRDLVEIGVDDLAMDDSDARELLTGAGVELPEADLDALIERAEGWPVGLYLGALALKAGGRGHLAGLPFSGDDRLMSDYLRAEVLSHLSEDEVTFLTRTSVLERMSGPLCDAVLETTGSADRLAALESSNLLMVPLDRKRQWYRYHQLFRDLLRAEFARLEPELSRRIHLRAAEWYESNGSQELAIGHAQASGDDDRVARLVLNLAHRTFASGDFATVLGWMDWLEERDLVDRYPDVAVYGATAYASLGRPAATERWTAAAEQGAADTVLPDGSTMSALVAQLHAQLCRDGPEQMRVDALLAQAELGPGSMWRGVALATEGLSYQLAGEPDRADLLYAHAVDVALHDGALPVATVALGCRVLVAIERGDWTDAEQFAIRAVELVEGAHLDEYTSTGLVYAAMARVALHRGNIAQAREYVAQATRLRPALSYALPHVSVLACLELARAYIGLADTAGARAVLREARDILLQRPDLGILSAQLGELQEKLDSMRAGSIGASALTAAELRLLPLLATHLTFPEIGERLHVSRHTVKTQAISIYQKLGVSSRSEAIDRAQTVGLLA